MKNSFVLLSFLILINSNLLAQFGAFGTNDAKSLGLGNTGNAFLFDVYSVGRNPAFLDVPEKETYLKAISPSFSSLAFSNSIPFDDINYFFGGSERRVLNQDDKDKLYSYFAETDERYFFHLSITPLTVAYKPNKVIGSFTFSFTDVIAGDATVPASLMQLLLNGNEVGKTYSFDNLKFTTQWLRCFSLSYSRELLSSDDGIFKQISAGLTLKYFNGFAFSSLEKVKSRFYTGEKNQLNASIEALGYSSFSDDMGVRYSFDSSATSVYNFNYFTKPAGSGFGFDLGFSFILDSGFTLGLSITDFGYVNWIANVAEHTSEGNIIIDDLFNQGQIDSLTNFGKMHSKKISNYNTGLPTTLRFGIAVELSRYLPVIPGTLYTLFDYNQGFNDVPSNSTTPRVSLGTYWLPYDYLPSLSMGISYDQSGHLRWSTGLGYSTSLLEIHLSTFDILPLIAPNYFKPQVSFALTLAWKII